VSSSLATEAAALGAIAAASPLPFLAVDELGEVRAWNAAAEELLGRPAHQMLGRPLHDEVAQAVVEQALHGEVVHSEPIAWTRGDGIEIELLLSSAPLYVETVVCGAIAFAMPLVDAPAHPENVLEGSRIAHELNNAMTAIAGYSQLLLARPEGDVRVRRDAERIAEAADRATSISHALGALVRRAGERTRR
jgi:PAS domain S-box-containing protein